MALIGEHRGAAASITRFGVASDQAAVLQAVDDAGDAAGGQVGLGGQVAHPQPAVRGASQADQDVEVGADQPEGGVHGAQLGGQATAGFDEQRLAESSRLRSTPPLSPLWGCTRAARSKSWWLPLVAVERFLFQPEVFVVRNEFLIEQAGKPRADGCDRILLSRRKPFLARQAPRGAQEPLLAKDFVNARDAAREVMGDVEDCGVDFDKVRGSGQQLVLDGPRLGSFAGRCNQLHGCARTHRPLTQQSSTYADLPDVVLGFSPIRGN